MANRQTDQLKTRATKLGLASFFGTLVLGLGWLKPRQAQQPLRPSDMALLGLATFRLGRLLAYDKVSEPLRAPFTRVVADSSGAGDTVVARAGAVREVFGELLACPVCAGTWMATGLVLGLSILPGPTRVLMTIMAATGAAELLNAVHEALSWSGRLAREEAGDH